MIRQFLSSGLNVYQGGNKVVIGAPSIKQPSHPWEVLDLTWIQGEFGSSFPNNGAWCAVFNPGFVNGIDPVLKGSVGSNQQTLNNRGGQIAIASSRAGVGGANQETYKYNPNASGFIFDPKHRKDLPLLQGPMMAFNFSLGRSYPGEKTTPLKIQNMGVPAHMTSDVSVQGETLVTKVNTIGDTKPTATAISIDIVLGMTRPVLTEQISFSGDAGIMSGRLVTYQWGYDDTVMRALGWRPFLYQMQDFDAMMVNQKDYNMQDLITNNPPADDGIDKLHLARVWAVSPLSTTPYANVDESWHILIEYRSFWNLCYQSRLPRIQPVYPPISYHSGLAFGLGDAIINSYLALQDEILQRVYNGVVNAHSAQGRFWNI